MLRPVFTSQSVGRPVASDTMFRSGDPPHMGQLVMPFFPLVDDACAAVNSATITKTRLTVMQSPDHRLSRADCPIADYPVVFRLPIANCRLSMPRLLVRIHP